MVCGTTSDAGKTLLVTGLCRLLARRGVRVAPFKAQNMALNSYVTVTGHEIGRAQAAQAMAAGLEPEVAMNPILLKPTGTDTSQLIVMGEVVAEVRYTDYRARTRELRQVVTDALGDLRGRYDVVVCEGAGGAAEINLLDTDVVNLPLAARAGLPVVIVGDIERGGVFASLYGTLALLPPDLRSLVKGFVINKFRGDPTLLGPGLDNLRRRCGVPTLGIIPWLDGVHIDAEDSLALDAPRRPPIERAGRDRLDVAVVRFPHISNFTDVDPLMVEPAVDVRFVTTAAIGDPDLLILPGTKATAADLAWLREVGLDRAVLRAARRDGPVILGICGGYQMLGVDIVDRVESGRGRVPGLGLLGVATTFEPTKVVRRRQGTALGAPVSGYEIHHGRTRRLDGQAGWLELGDPAEVEGGRSATGRVLGTSLHGIFEGDGFRSALLAEVARLRGAVRRPAPASSFAAARRAQHDRLADAIEAHVDLDALDAVIGGI